MSPKLMKTFLVLLMVVGAIIAMANVFSPELQSKAALRVVTHYQEPPDCSGPPLDCNDFTSGG